ncbi:hypothetical protein GW17_00026821 [Ensete ventricosum]|nr:hypothetical protein GW17_00026821 [Ensete ventricosum]
MQPRKPPPLSPLLPLLPIAYRRCPLPSSSANRSLDRPFFLSFLPHTVVALFLPPLPDAAFIAPSVLLTLPACRSSTVVSAPSNATQLPLPSLMSHLPPSLLRCFLFLAGPRCSSPQPLQRHQPSQTPQHSLATSVPSLPFSLLCFLLPLLAVAVFLFKNHSRTQSPCQPQLLPSPFSLLCFLLPLLDVVAFSSITASLAM